MHEYEGTDSAVPGAPLGVVGESTIDHIEQLKNEDVGAEVRAPMKSDFSGYGRQAEMVELYKVIGGRPLPC